MILACLMSLVLCEECVGGLGGWGRPWRLGGLGGYFVSDFVDQCCVPGLLIASG